MRKGLDGHKPGMMSINSKDSSNWNNKLSVLKGNFGECIVTDYLISKGYIPYRPDAPGAHPFDRLCASKDKKHIFIAEIKTKPARTYYPDTGINVGHYKDYLNIQNKYGIDVFLFFVDQDKKRIYGNKLAELVKRIEVFHNNKKLIYPLEQCGIIYFPLKLMIDIWQLDSDECLKLNELSERNIKYEMPL